ncbi:hypothetical protein FA95DRAFT_1460230, partial [Auriscalpium vulgare]
MVLPKHIPTLRSFATRNHTRPDNTFASEALAERVTKCHTLPDEIPTKCDHFPILTVIDMTKHTTIETARRNFRETDWDDFRDILIEHLGDPAQAQELDDEDEFDAAYEAFALALADAITRTVPISKPTPYSKRWWTKDLTRMKDDAKHHARKSYVFRADIDH